MRISQADASSQPPPNAYPLTAAMTGIGRVVSDRKTLLPFRLHSLPSSWVISRIIAMSAPATKAFSPPPVIIRQRVSSIKMLSIVSAISSNACALSAFIAFGRLIVMIPTKPFCSYFTNSTQILLKNTSHTYAVQNRHTYNNVPEPVPEEMGCRPPFPAACWKNPYLIFSTTADTPMPPPTQRVARPLPASRRFSS